MKNFLSVLLISVFLVLPISASASYLGNKDLKVVANSSGGSWNGWYADYETSDLDENEVFCVENIAIISDYEKYDFYTVDDSLTGFINTSVYGTSDSEKDAYVERLKEATWYANAWATSTVDIKKDAQVAIWRTLFTDVSTEATDGAKALMTAFGNADDQDKYTSNWLLAVSPSEEGVINIGQEGQNFLVAAPVPEPATMMLFGIGLIGLAGIARRKQ